MSFLRSRPTEENIRKVLFIVTIGAAHFRKPFAPVEPLRTGICDECPQFQSLGMAALGTVEQDMSQSLTTRIRRQVKCRNHTCRRVTTR